MKLILIRHGESQANKDRNVYLTTRDHQIDLTELGREQARKCGQELSLRIEGELVSVYVSPYHRTRETWKEIKSSLKSNQSMNIFEDPLLREQEYKIFVDDAESHEKKKEREEFGPFFYRFKNAESTADVYQRVRIFLNTLELQKIQGKAPKTVVVVAHEVVIRMFLMYLDNLTHEDSKTDIQNCQIIERDLK